MPSLESAKDSIINRGCSWSHHLQRNFERSERPYCHWS